MLGWGILKPPLSVYPPYVTSFQVLQHGYGGFPVPISPIVIESLPFILHVSKGNQSVDDQYDMFAWLPHTHTLYLAAVTAVPA